jgi:DNA-binding XRE family transcriptional regulator
MVSLKKDPNKLQIFHELKHSKIYVGELFYNEKKDVYILTYDKSYLKYKYAISLGPEQNLLKTTHISAKGQLFPIFVDRIPLKENPAYPDYCHFMGISVDEQNPIILLGTIGRRGPSTFIFEPVYITDFLVADIINLRKELDISQADFAKAFGLKKVTLQRIEAQTSHDTNTIKLLEIYFSFPDVALWQLKQTGINIHTKILVRLKNYFSQLANATTNPKNQSLD